VSLFRARDCQVFLSTSPSWISGVIRKVRGSRWSHTGILIENRWTVESTWKGLQIRDWRKCYLENPKSDYMTFAPAPAFGEALDRAVSEVMGRHIGCEYGYLQLLGFLAVWGFARLGLKIQNPIRDGDGNMVCTEFVDYCFIEAAKGNLAWARWLAPLHGNTDSESLGPDDVERWITADGGPFLRGMGPL